MGRGRGSADPPPPPSAQGRTMLPRITSGCCLLPPARPGTWHPVLATFCPLGRALLVELPIHIALYRRQRQPWAPSSPQRAGKVSTSHQPGVLLQVAWGQCSRVAWHALNRGLPAARHLTANQLGPPCIQAAPNQKAEGCSGSSAAPVPMPPLRVTNTRTRAAFCLTVFTASQLPAFPLQ